MIGVNFDPIQTKVPLWSSAAAKACLPWGANTHSQWSSSSQWEYFNTLPSANSKHFVSQSSEVHPGKKMIPIMHMYGIHTRLFKPCMNKIIVRVYKKLYVPSAQDERVGDIITRTMQRAGHAVFIIVSLELLHQYFSVNKQCFPLTTNQHKHQHKPNFSEVNRAGRFVELVY